MSTLSFFILDVLPIFYTIFRGKNFDYAIKIEFECHERSLNVISRSHVIVLDCVNLCEPSQNIPKNLLNLPDSSELAQEFPKLLLVGIVCGRLAPVCCMWVFTPG